MTRKVADWEPYGDNSHTLYLDCGHGVVIYFKPVPDEYDCELCDQTRIEFLKVWGHPTRNEIFGPGDKVRCRKEAAEMLVKQGIAKYLGGTA